MRRPHMASQSGQVRRCSRDAIRAQSQWKGPAVKGGNLRVFTGCVLPGHLLLVSYRHMSFRISVGVAFGEDVRRIAREQIDGAIAESNGSAPGSHTECIHSVRKRCKKLRALLRLVRPCLGDVYTSENAYFRDAARVLAPLRDTHVLRAAFDAVVGHFQGELSPGTFEPLRRQLERPEPQATDLEPLLADGCR